MTTETILLDRDAFRTTFDAWATEQESIDAQLSESLAALAAYQSHLDAWQQELAQERSELRLAREQLDREWASAAESQTHFSGETGAELVAARQKNAELTASLVARTEELRTLDSRHAELMTELELARARDKELKTALDEQKRLLEQERAQWNEDLRYLREMLEHRGETGESDGHTSGAAAQPAAEPPRPATPTNRTRSNNGAVLGSIIEQFGKLRQQRAVDRQGLRKAR
jgi:chromosome segregation ATPase